MMKKAMLVMVALVALQGCEHKPAELKSPCVGAEGSPCDVRTPINDHWTKPLGIS